LPELLMETPVWILLLILALLAGVLPTWLAMRRRRPTYFHRRFGYDHDLSLEDENTPPHVTEGVDAQNGRSNTFTIQPLTSTNKVYATSLWQSIQALFVDEPKVAIEEAEDLLMEVMRQRGFPSGDFEQLLADLTADYPWLLENYRALRTIKRRQDHGEATTEDLRQALLLYRSILDDLLEDRFARQIQVKKL